MTAMAYCDVNAPRSAMQVSELDTGPFTVVSPSLADIIVGVDTKLAFDLDAGRAYFFSFAVIISQSVLASLVGVGVNYTGDLTRIQYGVILPGGIGAASYGGGVANNVAVVDSNLRLATTVLPCWVQGSITTASAGRLSFRAQRSLGTTIISGGCGSVLRVG